MASQSGVPIRDQNLKFLFDGKEANVHKVQKKEGIGGRKALGDLTNSGKPSPIKASKRHDSKIFSSSKHPIHGKKSFSNAQEKVQTSGRKPLSDVSNTKNQICAREGLKKNDKNMKLNSVMGGYFLPNSIAEEQFLHNHDECIKAQSINMSEDYFLETIGLHNDFAMKLQSCHVPPASSRKPKPESPRKAELEEMAELMMIEEDQTTSPLRLKMELLPSACSCPPTTTPPKSPNLNQGPDCFVSFLPMEASFTMIETPVLLKH